MLSTLFLTPASIGYLAEGILCLAISAYVARRLRARPNRSAANFYLVGFLFCIGAYIFLLCLDAAFLSTRRLLVADLQPVALAVALVLLLQFAYHFPSRPSAHLREPWLVLAISGIYTLFEIGYAWVAIAQLARGTALLRSVWLNIPLMLGLAWAALVLLRQSFAASIHPGGKPAGSRWFTRALHPQGKAARAAYALACVAGLLFLLSLAATLSRLVQLSAATYQLLACLGIFLTQSTFIIIYFNAMPESNSLATKLVGTTLVISLAVLGTVGWLIAPPYVSTFTPSLPHQRSLRFTPNIFGGYDVSSIPYLFDPDWGTLLEIGHADGPTDSQQANFIFPFFGTSYASIFVGRDGVVGMGARLDPHNLQNGYGPTPAIFPLTMALASDSGGVYANQSEDNLLLTWEVSNYYHPEQRFSFQVSLHRDGIFELTYENLPASLRYLPDDSPLSSLWLIGAFPGNQANDPQPVAFFPTTTGLQGGPNGLVQDYYLEFRQYLQHLLMPLLYLLLADSLLVGLGLPFLIRYNLIRPLNALLAGLEEVENGNLDIQMPVRFRDEIGSLTASFNSMTARLRANLTDLKAHVAERTRELQTANDRLQSEMQEHAAAQQELLAQQNRLAVAEEHERMGRDLHDGLGQVMGYLNMETQAVRTLLEGGQVEAALGGLQNVSTVAQDAQARIRNFILGLQTSETHTQNLFSTIEQSLKQMGASLGCQTLLSVPAQAPDPLFSPAVETQAAYIIGEALKNVRQHARAGRVEVLISLAGEMAHIIVSDDGAGFDPQAAQADGHYGLSLMAERAETAGGRLEVRSAPGQGVQVLAFLPRLLSPVESSPRQAVLQLQNMRLLLADGSPLFLEGMRNLLLARGIQVVGLAHDGLEVCQKAARLNPDVIVMDIELPQLNGLEATRRIKLENPHIQIVILTVSESEEHLFDALRSGASGYLLKDLDADSFCRQLAGLARGESPLPSALSARLVNEFSHSEPVSHLGRRSKRAGLNTRQWQILDQVSQGLTYRETAEALSISEATVKYHMGQILERLQLKNREQAVAYARKLKPQE